MIVDQLRDGELEAALTGDDDQRPEKRKPGRRRAIPLHSSGSMRRVGNHRALLVGVPRACRTTPTSHIGQSRPTPPSMSQRCMRLNRRSMLDRRVADKAIAPAEFCFYQMLSRFAN